jgi:hypothetical protein
MGMPKGMPGMPPQNMYMGEVRYGYRPSPSPHPPPHPTRRNLLLLVARSLTSDAPNVRTLRYMHRPYSHPAQYAQHPAHAYMAAEGGYRHPDEHFGCACPPPTQQAWAECSAHTQRLWPTVKFRFWISGFFLESGRLVVRMLESCLCSQMRL